MKKRDYTIIWIFTLIVILGGIIEISASTPGNIDSCQVINVSGVYNLTNNLINSDVNLSSPTIGCFNINVSDVTLNCNGFYIRNTTLAKSGIYAGENIVNITVKNCNVTMNSLYGGYGIYFRFVNNSIIINNTANSNYDGIYSYSTSNLKIISNMVSGNCPYGAIYLYNALNSNVTLNTLSGGIGVFLQDSTNSIISFNLITSNNGAGIFLDEQDSSNTIASNNILTTGSGTKGISSSGEWRSPRLNTFTLNNISTNGSDASGISIYSTSSEDSYFELNNVTSNTILTTGSKSYGIDLGNIDYAGALGNIIAFNNISTTGLGSSGIHLCRSSRNNITSNVINVSNADRILMDSDFNENQNYEGNIFTNNSIVYRNYSYYDVNISGKVNKTGFVDQYLENYIFTSSGSLINIKNSKYGEIYFISPINGSGTNLSNDIKINNNSVYVNSSKIGLNKSANVILYGLSNNIKYPLVLRNGVRCNSLTAPSCSILTLLSGGSITFNVSSWSNYSISETILSAGNVSECGFLSTENGVYTLISNISSNGTCFEINATNITFNLGPYSIIGNNSGYGIYINNKTNTNINLGSVLNYLYKIYFYLANSGNNYVSTNANNYNITLDGTGNTTLVVNMTNLSSGNYCVKYDGILCSSNPNCTINSNSNGVVNVSLSVSFLHTLNILSDSSPPLVNVVSPANSASYSGSDYEVMFIFDANDSESGIANCSVYANGASYVNTSSISTINNQITAGLSAGSYSAYVNCTDLAGNIGNSSIITFAIAVPSTNNDNNGGGGGGIATTLKKDFWEVTRDLTKIDLGLGYNEELSYKERVKINLSIDGKTKTDYIGITKLEKSYVILNLSNGSQSVKLYSGNEEKFDLNMDGKNYEIYVKLNSISNNKANITIMRINEKIIPGNFSSSIVNDSANKNEPLKEITLKKDYSLILISSIIAAFAMIAIIIIIYLRELNYKKKINSVHMNFY
ncbi:Right handed beta helix region [uncultured archaeon]|nr:Right handed beta helix region [uncultured archaeon]